MAQDQYEEEQLEALKRWWAENGRSVITGVAIAIGVVAGWQGWQWYSDTRDTQAAAVYEQVLRAEPTDRTAIEAAADELRDGFSRTGYAALAALAAARAAVDAGDYDAAADWLRWAAEEARDGKLRHVARARLARVFGEQGDIEAGLALVTGDVPADWRGLYAEAEGDLHMRAGDPRAAVGAWERAREIGTGISDPQLLDMKINRARGEAAALAAQEGAAEDGSP